MVLQAPEYLGTYPAFVPFFFGQEREREKRQHFGGLKTCNCFAMEEEGDIQKRELGQMASVFED